MSRNYYIIPIFVPHEGCPHDCVFCNQNKITASESDKVDASFVRNTVEEYKKTINKESATVEISFFGGTFTAIPLSKQRELLEVAKEYKVNGYIDKIRLSTRPDYIDDEILSHLKFYGVDIIELGVQSLDDEVLRRSGRGHSVEDVIRASRLIREYGFILGHQIMLGLPGDTFEKDIETTKMSIEMKPNICRIYPSLVIKDTPMEKMFLRGDYKPYSLDEAIKISKVLYTMYKDARVNIIRIGLQPTDNINANGDVVAGPFHPSFRELVESSILNDKIYEAVSKFDGDVEITLSNRTISKLYSNKKKYFNELKDKVFPKKISIDLDNNILFNNVMLKVDEEYSFLSI